jgi:hypothetical protein
VIRPMARMLWGALLTVAAVAQSAHAEPAASDGQPAVWQSYDIVVHLMRLPRPYSCDLLWYKFRAVLLALGSGRVDEILPTDCASTSPTVHVRFVLPRLVSGGAAQYRDIQAAKRIIELRPGEPSRLQGSDCRLVQEMRESLLRDLPMKVVRAEFRCARPPANGDQALSPAMAHPGETFAVRVQAVMPLWPKQAANASFVTGR